jgi:hypothetical protein
MLHCGVGRKPQHWRICGFQDPKSKCSGLKSGQGGSWEKKTGELCTSRHMAGARSPPWVSGFAVWRACFAATHCCKCQDSLFSGLQMPVRDLDHELAQTQLSVDEALVAVGWGRGQQLQLALVSSGAQDANSRFGGQGSRPPWAARRPECVHWKHEGCLPTAALLQMRRRLCPTERRRLHPPVPPRASNHTHLVWLSSRAPCRWEPPGSSRPCRR